jgi:hypothetical protein
MENKTAVVGHDRSLDVRYYLVVAVSADVDRWSRRA